MNPTIEFILGYLACHFLAYAAYFRWIPFFRTELGVFLLHAISFAVFLCIVAMLPVFGVGITGLWAPHLALALSLHGIYSLSFLEAWSLTQGSYSLSILSAIAHERSPMSLNTIAPLCAIGKEKRSARNAVLVSLGLVSLGTNGGATLTGAGCVCARLIRFLLKFTGGRGLNR